MALSTAKPGEWAWHLTDPGDRRIERLQHQAMMAANARLSGARALLMEHPRLKKDIWEFALEDVNKLLDTFDARTAAMLNPPAAVRKRPAAVVMKKPVAARSSNTHKPVTVMKKHNPATVMKTMKVMKTNRSSMKAMKTMKVMKSMKTKKAMKTTPAMKTMKVMEYMKALKAYERRTHV